MTTWYVKVSYFDSDSDIEEYGSREEAANAYGEALDAGKELGDVCRISVGYYGLNSKMFANASKTFD